MSTVCYACEGDGPGILDAALLRSSATSTPGVSVVTVVDPHIPGGDGRLRTLPAGDRGLLVVPRDPGDLSALVDGLRAEPPPGVEDILPAAETVLLTLVRGAHRDSLRHALLDILDRSRTVAGAPPKVAQETATIEVHYGGEDLVAVATRLGVQVDEVVAAHTSRVWRCAFIGFAPGFSYLESVQGGLAVPRREQPRLRVPAGAVALADGYCAVYPRPSPGGWQIIGTTEAVMWDLDRPQPALVTPGMQVRFVNRDTR